MRDSLRRDKEKYCLYLSSSLTKRFRDMAYLKHGCIYGALSFELEAAMTERLAAFNNVTYTHTFTFICYYKGTGTKNETNGLSCFQP